MLLLSSGILSSKWWLLLQGLCSESAKELLDKNMKTIIQSASVRMLHFTDGSVNIQKYLNILKIPLWISETVMLSYDGKIKIWIIIKKKSEKIKITEFYLLRQLLLFRMSIEEVLLVIKSNCPDNWCFYAKRQIYTFYFNLTSDIFDIRLIYHHPNKPDMNILDLYLRTIYST